MIRDIALLSLVIPFTLWKGYIISILWNWFLTGPGFMPIISTFEAAGVLFVVNLATIDLSHKPDLKGWGVGESIGVHIAFPALVLFFGWIIRLLMNMTVTF